MTSYELRPSTDAPPMPAAALGDGVATAVLYRNARWFTEIRWCVTAAVLLAGVLSRMIPGTIRSLGIVPPVYWPWLAGGILAAGNTVFCLLVRRLSSAPSRQLVEAVIWMQIVLDLLVLTGVVHALGSIDSLVATFYLLHITLACVFFGQVQSLLVIALAGVLYVGCVGLEVAGILPARSFFAEAIAGQRRDPALAMLLAGGAVFVWVAVWYMVGTLSRAVRDRDRKLETANRDLVAADEKMNRQVLRTTHDLKAPFSGIESSIQVLRLKHWDGFSDDVRDILGRIERRGQTLSRRIGDILLLGELRSNRRDDAASAPADLRDIIEAAVENVRELAQSRGVSIRTEVPEVSVMGDQRLFTILFGNLLSNAVCYSREGGEVEVGVTSNNGDVSVSVTDHGIGISAEALPRVFDEYFRTKEGMQYNAMSTGLGLAIVKKIAQDCALTVRLTSEQGSYTTFEVSFPRKGE